MNTPRWCGFIIRTEIILAEAAFRLDPESSRPAIRLCV